MKNVEIKARCHNQETIRQWLKENATWSLGTDFQTDTYFKVPYGRLKLRQGEECALVAYKRKNQIASKLSEYVLHYPNPEPIEINSLKEALVQSLGILVVVKKRREIYYKGHIKFHLDEIAGLGKFVEIEVRDEKDERLEVDMRDECEHYQNLFNILVEDLIDCSYSDMLLVHQDGDD